MDPTAEPLSTTNPSPIRNRSIDAAAVRDALAWDRVMLRTVPHQFDALVSLCFNIGAGGFHSSTVLRQHRAGNYAAAADAFLMWDKDHHDGVLVANPGLLRRR